jgi:hypothetical protein
MYNIVVWKILVTLLVELYVFCFLLKLFIFSFGLVMKLHDILTDNMTMNVQCWNE